MFAVLTSVFLALFYVFKSLAIHARRVTRRSPEDDQPWQYTVSAILTLLSFCGVLVCGALWRVSWAS